MFVYIANMGNAFKFDYITHNPDKLGLCFTPMNHNVKYKGRFFVDNGAYHYYTHNKQFIATPMISLINRYPNYDFAILPDIVRGGKESLRLSEKWYNWLKKDIRWYLSVQDGITPNDISYFIDKIDGIFVGGSKQWKKDTMNSWIEFSHSIGLKCHIGRFGTLRKMIYARDCGADSIDSSNASKSLPAWNRLLDFLGGKYDNIHVNFEELDSRVKI